MKRLIRKAANQELYHATSMDSFFSILDSGELRPQETQSSDWTKKENIDYYFNGDEELYNKHMSNYTGYTFFGTDQYSVQQYGTRAANKSNFPEMYAIIKAELPEELLMPDLNDMPEAKTWQESSEQIGQVCVLGSVPVSQMTGVIMIHTYLHIEINTTFENWKDDIKKALAKDVKRGYYDADECYELWNRLGIPNNSQ